MKQPLAHRMRPTNIQEIIGQQHLVGEGKILWRMVQANHFQSMILYLPSRYRKNIHCQCNCRKYRYPVSSIKRCYSQ